MEPIYEPKGAAKEYGDYGKGVKMFSVYVHEFPNGKKYFGISKNIQRRFRNGKGYQGQKIVYDAIQKYGWQNVKTTILKTDLTEQEAKAEEIRLISENKTFDRNFGYNQTLGGEGANGRKLTADQKKAIGERFSKSNKGRPLSAEHKEKISASLKGKTNKLSEEGKRRIDDANHRKRLSRETRAKISDRTKQAMREKGVGEHLKEAWSKDKEKRKAQLRITMYNRYGAVPQKYDLRDDVINLGLDKEDYSELFD